MYGSSDSLAINSPMPSVYPIYVTANRQGSVEIYRDGLLINTQSVPCRFADPRYPTVARRDL